MTDPHYVIEITTTLHVTAPDIAAAVVLGLVAFIVVTIVICVRNVI